MMREIKIKEYDLEDMQALENLSIDQIVAGLERLDRGYFNQFVFLDENDPYKTYTEDEYDIYYLRRSLSKAIDLLSELPQN